MRLKLKIAIAIGIIVAGCGIFAGVDYYQRIARPRIVVNRRIRRNVDLVDHVDNHRVGQPDLIRNAQSPKLKLARSVVAMDARTGQIVYQRNPNQPRRIASVSKLMTLYLVEQKANRDHAWHQTDRFTNDAQLRRMSKSKILGGFKFQRHHRYTVSDLFKAALVRSSNSSAIALGEWVAGSNRNFIKLMNAQARAWHLRAHFISASGLENDDLKKYGLRITGGDNGANFVSAKSVAVIAQHLLARYPSITKVSGQKTLQVAGQTINNANSLLPGQEFAQPNLPVDGLKTGFTPRAGYCFVGTGKRKHHDRIITVVLHDANEFTDTRSLMKFVYRDSQLFNRK